MNWRRHVLNQGFARTVAAGGFSGAVLTWAVGRLPTTNLLYALLGVMLVCGAFIQYNRMVIDRGVYEMRALADMIDAAWKGLSATFLVEYFDGSPTSVRSLDELARQVKAAGAAEIVVMGARSMVDDSPRLLVLRGPETVFCPLCEATWETAPTCGAEELANHTRRHHGPEEAA